MSNSIWAAASGALAQLRQLDVTANNVANASTLGYRGDTLAFREVLGRAGGDSSIRHCRIDEMVANTAPGTLRHTGRALDVALTSPGYLAVRTEDGARYTRVGNLDVGTDGYLRTKAGHAVLNTDREPIRLPDGTPESAVAVGRDGSVTVAGAKTAQLRVVRFENDGALQKVGGPLLAATPDAGDPSPTEARFETATLEGSNVSPVKGMVDIVHATRAFEACQKVIESFKGEGQRGASSVMTPK